MEFTCYVDPSWKPLIRPAEPTRPWMDDTPESFAYRCLPLNIANAHGWEILCPCDAEASWTGRRGTEDLRILLKGSAPDVGGPVSLFGQGVLTFHVQALFRTPPGWDLWVSGSPNRPKDGIIPLTGIVETDWAPYTFTMNWLFTRRNHWVRFEALEPICFVFPIQRGALERMRPRIRPMSENPELAADFTAWSRSRDAFQAEMAASPPPKPGDKWQKRYYRGQGMRSDEPHPEHRSRLRLPPFVDGNE